MYFILLSFVMRTVTLLSTYTHLKIEAMLLVNNLEMRGGDTRWRYENLFATLPLNSYAQMAFKYEGEYALNDATLHNIYI